MWNVFLKKKWNKMTLNFLDPPPPLPSNAYNFFYSWNFFIYFFYGTTNISEPLKSCFMYYLNENKATQSPEISREQVQKLTPQFLLLAPPAERQRSFSNTDLSVVRLSVRPSVCPSVRPSVKIEGGGVYLRNASVTFLLFWHGASLGWHKSHIER